MCKNDGRTPSKVYPRRIAKRLLGIFSGRTAISIRCNLRVWSKWSVTRAAAVVMTRLSEADSSIQYPKWQPRSDPYVMSETLIWPTKVPWYSTTNGMVRPSLASANMRLALCRNVGGGSMLGIGDVASHSCNHSLFVWRNCCHLLASRTRSGRTETSPWLKLAGQAFVTCSP
jgi:hypothetical protein